MLKPYQLLGLKLGTKNRVDRALNECVSCVYHLLLKKYFFHSQKAYQIERKLFLKHLKILLLLVMDHGCLNQFRCHHCQTRVQNTLGHFVRDMEKISSVLLEDVMAAYEGDPAAKDETEIVLAYPGLLAVAIYRFSNWLYHQNVAYIPRMFCEHVHCLTGIDIHPGASIGKRFFIDHGTGVVIGQTAVIGENVKIYQGVTLGALSFRKNKKGELLREYKRHPTIQDDVVIYAGSTILGGQTIIGKGSIIGGNAWITKSIDPYSLVVSEHSKLIKIKKQKLKRRRHGKNI